MCRERGVRENAKEEWKVKLTKRSEKVSKFQFSGLIIINQS